MLTHDVIPSLTDEGEFCMERDQYILAKERIGTELTESPLFSGPVINPSQHLVLSSKKVRITFMHLTPKGLGDSPALTPRIFSAADDTQRH